MKAPTLRSGEQVVLNRFANRQVGWRAIGGRLMCTRDRLIFTPNTVDVRTGGEEWSLDLRHVKGVQVERRSDAYWRGLARLRPRLFIQTDEGEEAFLVNRAHHVGDLIAGLLPDHGA